jgi:Domain of unknown function (DUF4173)
MTAFVQRGLPRSVRLDGWWLTETTDDYSLPQAGAHRAGRVGRGKVRSGVPIALLALILAADVLFWRQVPGLSLAIFAVLVVIALSLTVGFLPKGRDRIIWTALLIAALLPVIERAQALSLLFATAGLLAWTVRVSAARRLALQTLMAGMARLAALLPWLGIADGIRATRGLARGSADAAVFTGLVRAWALPLTVGSVFVIAFTFANPVIDSWATYLFGLRWDIGPVLRRLMFWAAVAAVLWPLLSSGENTCVLRRSATSGDVTTRARIVLPGVNPASIANSLILFNLIFAVQTALDLTYLWGGAHLPAGTTHAEYSHRGAYPLVATALMAGAFALISRPYADDRPRLRVLLALWIVQNVALVISSLYRLDLYVDAYGLTYLRLRAGIWMALVAIGLGLVGVQLFRGKSNLWLLSVNAALLSATLYVCAFVNFAEVIARHNLDHAMRDATFPPDYEYICDLGPYAAPAIAEHLRRTGFAICSPDVTAGPVTRNWRDWGFRKWRIQRYLAASSASEIGRAFD